jgi:hypothetical protein
MGQEINDSSMKRARDWITVSLMPKIVGANQASYLTAILFNFFYF